MSETELPKQPLGVGVIISDTFSILFSNLFKVMVLGLIGVLGGAVVLGVLGIITAAVTGLGITGISKLSFFPPTFADDLELYFLVVMIAYFCAFGFISALVSSFIYDVKLGRQGTIRKHTRLALPAVVPIVLCYTGLLFLAFAIIFALTVLFARVLFPVPFLYPVAILALLLWGYASLYVMVPACVIEKVGFRSIARSFKLTQEYRWPLVGLTILVWIFTWAASGVSAIILEMLAPLLWSLSNFLGIVFLLSIVHLVFALITSVAAITVALTYARLREIKEGVDVDQIAAVFD
jgi:hypothetical protein